MKKIYTLLFTSAITAIATTSAMAADEQVVTGTESTASQYIPTSVRAEAGTTGYGGAITWAVNPYVGLSLGYDGGDVSWSNSLKVDGSKYDLKMNNNNVYLNAEMRPWGMSQSAFAKSLYVAAGAAYLDNDYDIHRNVSKNRNFSVNNTDYQAISDVKLKGKLKYKNDIAPYLGFGFAPRFGDHFGMFTEVGAYYIGNPEVQLDSTGTAYNASGKSLNNSVASEENKIRNQEKYKWLPSAKLGINYYF